MSRPSYFLLSRILLNFEAKSNDVISDISTATFSPDGSLWVVFCLLINDGLFRYN
jgi:hypothetical protein